MSHAQTADPQQVSDAMKAEGPIKGSQAAQLQSQVTKERNAEQATGSVQEESVTGDKITEQEAK